MTFHLRAMLLRNSQSKVFQEQIGDDEQNWFSHLKGDEMDYTFSSNGSERKNLILLAKRIQFLLAG